MLNDKCWKERHDQIVLWPYAWFGKATELLHCATLVLEKPVAGPLKGSFQNTAVFMMLHGFAFENMLKGLIVAKSPSTSQRKLFSTHELAKLAQEAGLKCSDQDENLLLRLQHFAVQGGRYPAPKAKEWQRYKSQLDGSGEQRRPVFLSADLNRIISLVHRIEAESKSAGVTCDLYDRSYSATSRDKTTLVERRIDPYRSP